MSETFESLIQELVQENPRYKCDAYTFVMEALNYTQQKFKINKHVTGEELLIGAKELLLDKYGPMAKTVLEHWGIVATEDFGHIVFNLIQKEILSKTDEDRIDHFRDVYDFEDVFNKDYRENLGKAISSLKSVD